MSIKKTNVVIGSVLKPVDDTRMYEKFALTLAQEEAYKIHIIGFRSRSQKAASHQNITFYPLFNFSRLSLKRFVASWIYYKKLLTIKPEVIVVTNIDLLIVTVLYKILFGTKILYDVQENNLANALYTKKFRPPLNFIAGYLMRVIEYGCSPFITHFILAEKIYQKELSFLGQRSTVIENKYRPLVKGNLNYRKKSIYHLLYSGTIAESYGIFEAIELTKNLYNIDNRFHLTIIGFCADPVVFAKVLRISNSCPFIHIIGGNILVPHSDIMEAIQKADIGLIAYQYNKSTVERIPTKLYEYIYYSLPMLIPDNSLWKDVCKEYKAAFVIDYQSNDSYSVVSNLLVIPFYVNNIDKGSILWDKENNILINLFSKL